MQRFKAIFVAMFSVLASCSRSEVARANDVEGANVHATIEIRANDGSIERKEFSLDGASDLRAVESSEKTKNGDFVIRYTVRDGVVVNKMEMHGRVEEGKVNGPVSEWVVGNGERRLVGKWSFKEGIKTGEQRGYYPKEGTMQFEGSMIAGIRDGLWSIYYPSGEKAGCLRYSAGVLNGRAEFFSETGELVASGDYEMGVIGRGTFIENMEEFIFASFDSKAIVIQVLAHSETGEATREQRVVNGEQSR